MKGVYRDNKIKTTWVVERRIEYGERKKIVQIFIFLAATSMAKQVIYAEPYGFQNLMVYHGLRYAYHTV